MEIKSRKPVLRFAPAKAGFAFAGVLPLLVAAQAQAVEFSFADNEVIGNAQGWHRTNSYIPLEVIARAPVEDSPCPPPTASPRRRQ